MAEVRYQSSKIHSSFFPKRCQLPSFCGRRETETRSCVSCQDWVSSGLGTQGSGRRRCCRFGASSRSCCCCCWSIGSGSGGMDGNFGTQERILWPASVLAGIVMCGAVSFPRLAPPCFFSCLSLAEFQTISSLFVPFKPSTHSSFLFNLRQSSCACCYLCPNPQIFHHYRSFFFWYNVNVGRTGAS